MTAPLDAAEKANAFAGDDTESLARKLHDGSIFAAEPHGVPWEQVDPIMRQRRLAQAYDLKTLGYVQRINDYYPSDHVLQPEAVSPINVPDGTETGDAA